MLCKTGLKEKMVVVCCCFNDRISEDSGCKSEGETSENGWKTEKDSKRVWVSNLDNKLFEQNRVITLSATSVRQMAYGVQVLLVHWERELWNKQLLANYSSRLRTKWWEQLEKLNDILKTFEEALRSSPETAGSSAGWGCPTSTPPSRIAACYQNCIILQYIGLCTDIHIQYIPQTVWPHYGVLTVREKHLV